jgi:hypothetical protein
MHIVTAPNARGLDAARRLIELSAAQAKAITARV